MSKKNREISYFIFHISYLQRKQRFTLIELLMEQGADKPYWGGVIGYMLLSDYSDGAAKFKLPGVLQQAQTKKKSMSNLCVFVDNNAVKGNSYQGKYYQNVSSGIRHAGKSNMCAMDGSVKAVRTTWNNDKSSWQLIAENHL